MRDFLQKSKVNMGQIGVEVRGGAERLLPFCRRFIVVPMLAWPVVPSFPRASSFHRVVSQVIHHNAFFIWNLLPDIPPVPDALPALLHQWIFYTSHSNFLQTTLNILHSLEDSPDIHLRCVDLSFATFVPKADKTFFLCCLQLQADFFESSAIREGKKTPTPIYSHPHQLPYICSSPSVPLCRAPQGPFRPKELLCKCTSE